MAFVSLFSLHILLRGQVHDHLPYIVKFYDTVYSEYITELQLHFFINMKSLQTVYRKSIYNIMYLNHYTITTNACSNIYSYPSSILAKGKRLTKMDCLKLPD